MNESRKSRRTFSPADKIALLRRHLVEKALVSDLCEEQNLNVNQFYGWQRQLFENGATAFERQGSNRRVEDAKDRKIARLEEKLAQKNEVIAELMEENVRAKKANGEL